MLSLSQKYVPSICEYVIERLILMVCSLESEIPNISFTCLERIQRTLLESLLVTADFTSSTTFWSCLSKSSAFMTNIDMIQIQCTGLTRFPHLFKDRSTFQSNVPLFLIGKRFSILSFKAPISSEILLSSTLEQIWVVEMELWPNILLTVSIGTPFPRVIVVANVCLAKWVVKFLRLILL